MTHVPHHPTGRKPPLSPRTQDASPPAKPPRRPRQLPHLRPSDLAACAPASKANGADVRMCRRRRSVQPRRLRASHDEDVPSLSVLQRWNASAQLPVCVVEVAGKGLGILARRALPAGTVVAAYPYRIVKRKHAPPGDFRVEIGRRGCVGKLDRHSFGPPRESDGVALFGALLNEPSKGETANCVRQPGIDERDGRHRGVFCLRTMRAVEPNEELTWDYGSSDGRRAYHED